MNRQEKIIRAMGEAMAATIRASLAGQEPAREPEPVKPRWWEYPLAVMRWLAAGAPEPGGSDVEVPDPITRAFLAELGCPGPDSTHDEHATCHRCPTCRTPVNPWYPCPHCGVVLSEREKWPPLAPDAAGDGRRFGRRCPA